MRFLNYRLGDEHTIKRVGMMQWKVTQGKHMFEFKRKDLQVVFFPLLLNNRFQGRCEL